MDFIEQLRPYGVADLVDINDLAKTDEYYPYTTENGIDDEIVLKAFLRAGYVYDRRNCQWYVCLNDGLYYPLDDEQVKDDILDYLHRKAPSHYNIPLKNRDGIYERLKSCSYRVSCVEKYDDFLSDHPEYEIPFEFDGFTLIPNELIPVRNGLINPATMELVPHCRYLIHHNVYNFDYRKMSEDEILYSPARDTYAQIIPDEKTLDHFLWWVGAVLFSPELIRIWMVLYGLAGTGKTTLSLGISEILSGLSYQENYGHFKNSKFATSGFVGKKLVVIDEIGTDIVDSALIKQLSGGTSEIVVEPKYKDPRKEKLSAKFLLIGNDYPQTVQDTGIIDRFHIIPCENKIDQTVHDCITENSHLNWLFNAAHYYYVVKHPHTNVRSLSELRTPLMLRELDRYRDLDMFVSWIKDYLDIDEITVEDVQNGLDRRASNEVYNDYKYFVDNNGGMPLKRPKFNQKLLLEYGLDHKNIRGIDGWMDGKQYKGYRVIK